MKRIPTLPANRLRLGDVLPVVCASEVRFAQDVHGQPWVAKRCSGGDVVAEACAWLLARELGVPVVDDVCVATDEDALWWLGSFVPNAQHFAASHASATAEALGAMFALDALLGNEDRHARNLLVAYRGAGKRLIAIDFAGSWCCRPTSFLERGVEAPRLDSLAEGFSRTLIAASARATGARIEALLSSVLSSVAEEACAVAKYGRVADLDEALHAWASFIHAILDGLLLRLP